MVWSVKMKSVCLATACGLVLCLDSLILYRSMNSIIIFHLYDLTKLCNTSTAIMKDNKKPSCSAANLMKLICEWHFKNILGFIV